VRQPTDSLQKAFGLAVRQHRLAGGLSQEELADRAGLHRTYVSQIERGLKSPSLNALTSLAEALGTAPHALLRAAEEANRR
jgi:transcriptional regulator with XRE-family HTH domain